MSVFRTRVTLAAGQVNNNVMNGSKFEFLGRPSAVQIHATQDGTGSPSGLVDFSLGNAIVGDDLPPNVATTAGAVKLQEDGLAGAVGMAGDRVQVRVRNAHAASAVNVTLVITINEIAQREVPGPNFTRWLDRLGFRGGDGDQPETVRVIQPVAIIGDHSHLVSPAMRSQYSVGALVPAVAAQHAAFLARVNVPSRFRIRVATNGAVDHAVRIGAASASPPGVTTTAAQVERHTTVGPIVNRYFFGNGALDAAITSNGPIYRSSSGISDELAIDVDGGRWLLIVNLFPSVGSGFFFIAQELAQEIPDA